LVHERASVVHAKRLKIRPNLPRPLNVRSASCG